MFAPYTNRLVTYTVIAVVGLLGWTSQIGGGNSLVALGAFVVMGYGLLALGETLDKRTRDIERCKQMHPAYRMSVAALEQRAAWARDEARPRHLRLVDPIADHPVNCKCIGHR